MLILNIACGIWLAWWGREVSRRIGLRFDRWLECTEFSLRSR
jgi:hypothetical protein